MNDLIDILDIGFVDSTIEGLSAFLNRFYTSTPGVQSAEWIYGQVSDIEEKNERTIDEGMDSMKV